MSAAMNNDSLSPSSGTINDDLRRPLLLLADVEAVAVVGDDGDDDDAHDERYANHHHNTGTSAANEEEEEEGEEETTNGNNGNDAVIVVDEHPRDVEEQNDDDNDEENENENEEIILIIIIKFIIFVLMTFISIALVHIIVGHLFNDRDKHLKIWQIILYVGDSIIRDCFIFFIIGRVYKQQLNSTKTICIWLTGILIANIYFESQNYIWFLQHSVSLYEMHCIWPWELWLFALGVVILFSSVFIAHAKVAYQKRNLLKIKIIEISVCIILFIIPLVVVKHDEIQYLHFHHWFAGWFIGMHFSIFDKWWSIGCMAYCYGMYINGIAVYGRDPLLTCDYANFLVNDLNCPSSLIETTTTTTTTTTFSSYNDISLLGMLLNGDMVHAALSLFVGDYYDIDVNLLDPAADWRNCSSKGYHP
jgi:hypothetical protein